MEFNIVGVGTETARLSYGEIEDCNIPVYYIQNMDITPAEYRGGQLHIQRRTRLLVRQWRG